MNLDYSKQLLVGCFFRVKRKWSTYNNYNFKSPWLECIMTGVCYDWSVLG